MPVSTTIALIAAGYAYHPTRDDLNSTMESKGVEIARPLNDHWEAVGQAVWLTNSLEEDTNFQSVGARYVYKVTRDVTVSPYAGLGRIEYGRPAGKDDRLYFGPVGAVEGCVGHACVDLTYIPPVGGIIPAAYFQFKLKIGF